MSGPVIKPQVRSVSGQRIDTARLRLRPPVVSDAAEIARLVGEWEVAHWLVRVPYPYRTEHARAWIERSAEERRVGSGWPFLLERRDDGAILGSIDLSMEDGRTGASVGYWVGKPFWGRGYASEAAIALLGYAFDVLMLAQVTASVLPDNQRSARVLEKAGFRFGGRRHEDTYERGRVETDYYSIRRSAWRSL